MRMQVGQSSRITYRIPQYFATMRRPSTLQPSVILWQLFAHLLHFFLQRMDVQVCRLCKDIPSMSELSRLGHSRSLIDIPFQIYGSNLPFRARFPDWCTDWTEYKPSIRCCCVRISKFLVIFQAYAAHPTTRGFKTTAKRTSLRGYPDVISEVIIVSRSTLVQTYVIIIVIAVCVLPFSYIPQMVH